MALYHDVQAAQPSEQMEAKQSTPAILQQGALVQEQTKQLDELIRILAERLVPILGPERPALASSADKEPMLSPHASFLREHAVTLSHFSRSIAELLSRLEL